MRKIIGSTTSTKSPTSHSIRSPTRGTSGLISPASPGCSCRTSEVSPSTARNARRSRPKTTLALRLARALLDILYGHDTRVRSLLSDCRLCAARPVSRRRRDLRKALCPMPRDGQERVGAEARHSLQVAARGCPRDAASRVDVHGSHLDGCRKDGGDFVPPG